MMITMVSVLLFYPWRLPSRCCQSTDKGSFKEVVLCRSDDVGWGIVLGRAQWCWMTRVVQVRDGDADN